jgi:rhamnosyltransferase subunit B
MPPQKVVLATFGTHGDLHPFMAIGLGLREHGFDSVIATSEHFRDNVEAAGLRFHALRPSRDQIEADAALTQTQILRAVRIRPQLLLTQFMLPYLSSTYEDSLAALQDATLVFTSTLAFGTKLAAEKLNLPHIGVVLQPSTLLSTLDPPLFGNALSLSRLAYQGGRSTTRAWLGLVRLLSRCWTCPIARFRRRIGLPNTALHPLFEGQFFNGPAVGLYSRLLGEVQPDFPPRFVIAGFAFYDAPSAATPSDADTFIDRGPPPLLFTQGTSAVHDSTRFTQVALEAVRRLGERAIFVLDDAQRAAFANWQSPDLLITGYVPYSTVFSRCKAIAHHAGIGTTAQALRSGRPQLISPYFADQPDNAARVARLGVARVLPPAQWSTARVADALRCLIADSTMSERAVIVSQSLHHEHAVDTVARLATETIQAPLGQQTRHMGT